MLIDAVDVQLVFQHLAGFRGDEQFADIDVVFRTPQFGRPEPDLPDGALVRRPGFASEPQLGGFQFQIVEQRFLRRRPLRCSQRSLSSPLEDRSCQA